MADEHNTRASSPDGDSHSEMEALSTRVNRYMVEAELLRLKFDQVFDAIHNPLWLVDRSGTVIEVNQAFVGRLGLSSKRDALGKKCREILEMAECGGQGCCVESIWTGNGAVEVETSLPIESAGQLEHLLSAYPLQGLASDTIGAVLQLKDISEQKRYERELQEKNRELDRLSRLDGLTRIANRRVFEEVLEKEWRRGGRRGLPISLLMIDVDFFKLYNDHYGHIQGDTCLREVATLMASVIHRPHDLAARYGGEEFACLLPDTDREGASMIGETILNLMRQRRIPHAASGVADHVTVSIGGCTLVPAPDSDPGELLSRADAALYRSKEEGRDRLTFSGDLQDRSP